MNLQLILPVLAVGIGIGLSFLLSRKSIVSRLLLSFSGAFLLALTFFELLPEVYASLDAKATGLFIMLGILLQVILEFFSKGAEHGHIHNHVDSYLFPWVLFISLCIHSLLEGFPLDEHNDIVYGVFVHKIPIAMVLTTFLVHSNFSKAKIVFFLGVFSIMTPLGTLIATLNQDLSTYFIYLNAMVIGIFLHISTVILFESEKGHSFNLSKLAAIIIGLGLAYLI